MDFIKKYIEQNSGVLTDSLTNSGFSQEQAKQFLPEAATGIIDVADKFGVEQLVSGFTSGQQDKLLSMINVDGIASKLGIDSAQVSSGFESIVPVITSYLSQNNGGLSGALSSLASGSSGGLFGSIKKILG